MNWVTFFGVLICGGLLGYAVGVESIYRALVALAIATSLAFPLGWWMDYSDKFTNGDRAARKHNLDEMIGRVTDENKHPPVE